MFRRHLDDSYFVMKRIRGGGLVRIDTHKACISVHFEQFWQVSEHPAFAVPLGLSVSETSYSEEFADFFRLVVPTGIEPVPTASEAIVLSIGPRDQTH